MELVSACLVGRKCRYDGDNSKNEKIIKYYQENKENIILVCPEELGGLSTPRKPCEICSSSVLTKDGLDCTKEFNNGAEKTLDIAKKNGVKRAILKSKSPSCGCGQIYDGQFQGRLILGDGVTTKLLKENGIQVISDEEM